MTHPRFSVRLTAVLFLTLALALGWFPGSAHAITAVVTDRIDQQLVMDFPTSYAAIDGTGGFGQTFTAGISGTLDRISLYVQRTPELSPGALTVSIYNTGTDGLPTGSALASGSIPQAVTDSGYSNWLDISLSSALSVVAGTTYAIKPSAPNQGYSFAGIGDEYAGGGEFAYGGFLGFEPSADLLFKTYVIETTAPDTTIDFTKSPGNGYYPAGTELGFYPSDTDDDQATLTTYYSIGDSTCTPSHHASCQVFSWDSRPELTTEGSQTIYFFSVDPQGNAETQQDPTVSVDLTPPSTYLAGAVGGNAYTFGTGTEGDTNHKVTVTLTPSDGVTPLSGVDKTYYSVNDPSCTPADTSTCNTYSAPVDVGGSDGIYIIHFFSTDKAGNVEDTQGAVVLIDTTPPTTTASGDVPAQSNAAYNFGDWASSPVEVALNADDGNGDGSGVGTTYYSIDSNACTPASTASCTTYSSPFTVSTEGTHTIYYFSVDTMGHAEEQQSVTAKLDKTVPHISLTAPISGSVHTLHESASGAYSCSDLLADGVTEGSGVASCTDNRNGSSSNAGSLNTSSVTNATTGPRTYTVSAQDNAGNTNNLGATYTVHYASSTISCKGSASRALLQPLNPDGTSVFPHGSTIPLKFRVCDAAGVSIGTNGLVTGFKQLSSTSIPTSKRPNESLNTSKTTGAFTWDATNKLWTRSFGSGSLARHKKYNYQISLNDGTTIPFTFSIG